MKKLIPSTAEPCLIRVDRGVNLAVYSVRKPTVVEMWYENIAKFAKYPVELTTWL